jgi:hypothetical protein
VAKVRERLEMSKQTTHRVHMERFNLKKLNEIEDIEQYRVQISNRFAAVIGSSEHFNGPSAFIRDGAFQK